jgi:hypothetical protein
MARSVYVSSLCFLALGGAVACGGASGAATTPATTAASSGKIASGVDDQSRCDFKGRPDREVVESNGPGAVMPNVRRVFGILGEGDDRRRVLFCREIDTNLDGVKDVVRTYNDKGDAVDEQADTDYDGKVDTWIRFAGGRISKVDLDTNKDGRPDETRYYVKGQISRVQRDTNNDGKPDVWEIYSDGQLERMGTDLDFDGHVDRWDRDEVAHRAQEEKDREDQEKADAAKKAEDAANAASAGKPGAPAAKPIRSTDEAPKPKAVPGTTPAPATSTTP